MYGCESWTVKKAEHQRIDDFELWCWRRLLRVPWTARRSNQSILKEISPGCSLKGLMLKLKLQYFGHLMWKVDSLEKTLMQEEKGTTEDELARWHHWLDGREFEWTLGVGDGEGGLECCNSWGRKESDMTERLNWTELSQDQWEKRASFTKGKNQLWLTCLWNVLPRGQGSSEQWNRNKAALPRVKDGEDREEREREYSQPSLYAWSSVTDSNNWGLKICQKISKKF